MILRLLFALRCLALRADTENLQQVRDLGIAHLPRHALQSVGHANIQRLCLVAGAANDVVVMMLAGVDLVAIGPIAEIAAPDDGALFHRREAAVDRHQVATAFLHPPVDFLRREGAMLMSQDAEDGFPRFGHALVIGAQQLQRGLELRLGSGMIVRHLAHCINQGPANFNQRVTQAPTGDLQSRDATRSSTAPAA